MKPLFHNVLLVSYDGLDYTHNAYLDKKILNSFNYDNYEKVFKEMAFYSEHFKKEFLNTEDHKELLIGLMSDKLWDCYEKDNRRKWVAKEPTMGYYFIITIMEKTDCSLSVRKHDFYWPEYYDPDKNYMKFPISSKIW